MPQTPFLLPWELFVIVLVDLGTMVNQEFEQLKSCFTSVPVSDHVEAVPFFFGAVVDDLFEFSCSVLDNESLDLVQVTFGT